MFCPIQSFDYHCIDYQKACYNKFIFSPFNQSWYFNFQPNSQITFPINEWWLIFGIIQDICLIQDKKINPILSKYSINSKPIETPFNKQFGISWILCGHSKLLSFTSHQQQCPLFENSKSNGGKNLLLKNIALLMLLKIGCFIQPIKSFQPSQLFHIKRKKTLPKVKKRLSIQQV